MLYSWNARVATDTVGILGVPRRATEGTRVATDATLGVSGGLRVATDATVWVF